MASNIRVHSGRTSYSWDEFIALFKSHYQNETSNTAVDRILGLETLRQTRYIEAEAYSLSNLLDTFRDCFCAVPHDKIYSFIGMANDRFHGFMLVDYGRSLFDLYEDAVMFQNLSSSDPIEKQIGMIYYSGLIRRLLTRKSGKVLRRKRTFALESQTWVDWYASLLGPDSVISDGVSSTMIFYVVIDRLTALVKWVISFFKPQTEPVMIWHPSEPEFAETWLPKLKRNDTVRGIRVRGAIAGHIRYIGPAGIAKIGKTLE